MRHENQIFGSLKARAEIVVAGVGVAGAAPTVGVQRVADGNWLAAGGGGWAAGFATNPMAAVDAVNMPGLYEYAVPTAQQAFAFTDYLFVIATPMFGAMLAPLLEHVTVSIEQLEVASVHEALLDTMGSGLPKPWACTVRSYGSTMYVGAGGVLPGNRLDYNNRVVLVFDQAAGRWFTRLVKDWVLGDDIEIIEDSGVAGANNPPTYNLATVATPIVAATDLRVALVGSGSLEEPEVIFEIDSADAFTIVQGMADLSAGTINRGAGTIQFNSTDNLAGKGNWFVTFMLNGDGIEFDADSTPFSDGANQNAGYYDVGDTLIVTRAVLDTAESGLDALVRMLVNTENLDHWGTGHRCKKGHTAGTNFYAANTTPTPATRSPSFAGAHGVVLRAGPGGTLIERVQIAGLGNDGDDYFLLQTPDRDEGVFQNEAPQGLQPGDTLYVLNVPGSSPREIWDFTLAEAHGLGEESIGAAVAAQAGLSGHNFRIKNAVYAANRMTSADLLVYATKADADGDVNELATFALTATYDGNGDMATYLVTRAP